MDKEEHAFYVVRKGDIVSIYRSLSDCQAQVCPSVCDPPVSVYKGYFLRKEAEDYLASHGLKNPSYAINEADVKENLFGALMPCRFQEVTGSTSISTGGSKTPIDLGLTMEAQPVSYNHMLCILEFDGASKGNPGKAGAGAVIRNGNGQVLCLLREGLGVVTNNVAEYRGLILGMKYALRKGYRQIRVTGDSQLICMQVQGLWQTKHQNMIELCKQVKELKSMFLSFQISHVRRVWKDLNFMSCTNSCVRHTHTHGHAHANLGLLPWNILRLETLLCVVRQLLMSNAPQCTECDFLNQIGF